MSESCGHGCPMFDADRAQRLEDGLEKLLDRQLAQGETLTKLAAAFEIWLGNGKPGIVRTRLDRVDDAIEKANQLHDNCKLDCDTKINAVRMLATSPTADHEFVVAQQAKQGLWDKIRASVVPLLAAVLGSVVTALIAAYLRKP